MPVIYYAYYSPESNRIADISAQEHLLGRRLLSLGLEELYRIIIPAAASAMFLKQTKTASLFSPNIRIYSLTSLTATGSPPVLLTLSL